MAIKKSLELDSGIFIENAYIRIDTISGYKDSITISVNSYSSKEAFTSGRPYISQKFYTFSPDVSAGAPEMFTQGYNYLKTSEEYAGAEDDI